MSNAKSVTPKQLGIVLGSTVLLAILGLWLALGDRPNVTCLSEACSNFGFCTGHRFECIRGSDKDCRSSKDCSESGECALVGAGCGPGSKADCEQSQACKKEGRCIFVAEGDGHACETQRDVQKHQEEAASQAVAPWLALVQSAASGQETSAALAATIAAPQLDGFQVENPAPTLLAMEVGQATWNGNHLPAAIVRVTVPFVNRTAGERRAVCFVQAALHDEEFKMWRQMQTFGCQESGLAQGVQQWRTSNGFTATQLWPSPPAPGVDATSAPAPSASAASAR